MEDTTIENADLSGYPKLTRLAVFFVSRVSSLVDRIFGLSLFFAVMAMGILMAMPIVGVWALFVAAHFLPFPFGPIVMWGMIGLLVTFAAAADYVHRS